jgi:hypothetical protein
MASADWNDVRFDYDGSLDLARRLWQFADRLDALGGARHRWAVEALVEWEGRFGVEFADRVDVEIGDVGRIGADVRNTALGWAQAWANALNQQNRRLHARAVERTRQQRSNWDKVSGWLTGHDDLPPDPWVRATPTAPYFAPTGSFAIYRINQ